VTHLVGTGHDRVWFSARQSGCNHLIGQSVSREEGVFYDNLFTDGAELCDRPPM
jgi:hypothetical protein